MLKYSLTSCRTVSDLRGTLDFVFHLIFTEISIWGPVSHTSSVQYCVPSREQKCHIKQNVNGITVNIAYNTYCSILITS